MFACLKQTCCSVTRVTSVTYMPHNFVTNLHGHWCCSYEYRINFLLHLQCGMLCLCFGLIKIHSCHPCNILLYCMEACVIIMLVVDPSIAVEMEEIMREIFPNQEGGGMCVTFKSFSQECLIIGYPDNGLVKCNVSRFVCIEL